MHADRKSPGRGRKRREVSNLSAANIYLKRSVFAITGGIGAGNSEVARLLTARGFPVIGYDGLAGELACVGGAAYLNISSETFAVILC